MCSTVYAGQGHGRLNVEVQHGSGPDGEGLAPQQDPNPEGTLLCAAAPDSVWLSQFRALGHGTYRKAISCVEAGGLPEP